MSWPLAMGLQGQVLNTCLSYVFFRMEMGEEPLVRTAAAVFQDLCYNYRDQLSAGIICAGWDKKKGGQVREN